jgi:DNA-binding SARP family transcriptional activator
VRFEVLGTLAVRDDDGTPVRLPTGRAATVLAVLLFEAGRPVPVPALTEALWRGRPPASHVANLQTYVSRLRRVLGGDRIQYGPGGYRVRVGDGELDLALFAVAGRDGRRATAAGDHAAAAGAFRAALALWRGRPLNGLAVPALEPRIRALVEDHLAVVEDRLDAELATGRAADLVGELLVLVEAHPRRERLRGQLMLALARAGRAAEALECYARGRALAVEQAGLEPGPALRRLHLSILRGSAGPRSLLAVGAEN